jgi:hypothetical protein
LFCGGDASEADHLVRCDGRQGAIESAAVDDGPVVGATIITWPRETSVKAFYEQTATGKIPTRRLQVWVGLEALGIATAGEVFEYLKETRRLGLRYDSNTSARFTELRDDGLIREMGERACRVTGQTCITWAVVPEQEYAGRADVQRCPTCGQITAKIVPRWEARAARS